MYLATKSMREEFVQVIVRKDREAREWVNKNLDGTERYAIVRDPNGLGLRVAIISIRAKEKLMGLHRSVFSPVFAKPTPSLDQNGVWSAWFGFSEPLNHSTYYIPLDR
jgi:hypothetical protein